MSCIQMEYIFISLIGLGFFGFYFNSKLRQLKAESPTGNMNQM